VEAECKGPDARIRISGKVLTKSRLIVYYESSLPLKIACGLEWIYIFFDFSKESRMISEFSAPEQDQPTSRQDESNETSPQKIFTLMNLAPILDPQAIRPLENLMYFYGLFWAYSTQNNP
jgi:hypothetical protein